MRTIRGATALWLALLTAACTDGNEADRVGVGAECATAEACPDDEDSDTPELECLAQFAGGYCGLSDCVGNDDCPIGSACVAHTDGENYCFRLCEDKPECNVNRSPDVEANCSSNVVFVDSSTDSKACVPPSSGT